LDVINPARFRSRRSDALWSEADVDAVLDQAQSAYQTWSHVSSRARVAVARCGGRLHNALPELAILFVRENGKPLREAEIDIRRSIELMEMIAADLPEWSKPEILDERQPVCALRRARGVTAVISPWNSPVLLSFKRFVPAIATGNTVVLKPATYCPLRSTAALASLVNTFRTCSTLWRVPVPSP
jgi:acyl-CoA reductase-like NAD-dependent aldehyde dehydrogenase